MLSARLIRLIHLQLEQGWEFRITRAFDHVIRCLRNGAQMAKVYRASAKELIDKPPKAFQAQIITFRELVEKAVELPVPSSS